MCLGRTRLIRNIISVFVVVIFLFSNTAYPIQKIALHDVLAMGRMPVDHGYIAISPPSSFRAIRAIDVLAMGRMLLEHGYITMGSPSDFWASKEKFRNLPFVRRKGYKYYEVTIGEKTLYVQLTNLLSGKRWRLASITDGSELELYDRDVYSVEEIPDSTAFTLDSKAEIIVEILRKLDARDALVIKEMKSPNPWDRLQAVEAFCRIGDELAVDSLLSLLRDGAEVVRRYAAQALGHTGNKRSVKSLIKAVKDRDIRVREAAILALGKIGSKTATRPLIGVLRNKRPLLRMSACIALCMIGDERAVEPLIEVLQGQGEDKYVRIYAIEALGRIGSKLSLDALIKLMLDEDADIRITAARAIWDINIKSGGEGKAMIEPPAFAQTAPPLIDEIILWHFIDPFGSNIETMKEMFYRIGEVMFAHLTRVDEQGPLVPPQTPDELQKLFQWGLPRDPIPFNDVMERYIRYVQRRSIMFGDPSYAAHMHPFPPAIAIFAESLIAALNANLIVWESSPAATYVELEVLRWLAEIIGYDPKRSSGSIVSGGTAANHTALLIARNHVIFEKFEQKKTDVKLTKFGYSEHHLPDVTKIGINGVSPILQELYPKFKGRFVFLASETAHYSLKKLAGYLGLGSDNVIVIETKDGVMDVSALEKEIKACKKRGDIILSVIATAGTTEEGLFDPLEKIAEITKRHGLRLHVDAAYGGAIKTSERYKHLAKGIELADSVTFDPHKLLYMSYAIGAILVRNKEDLEYVTQAGAPYLFREAEETRGVVNLGRFTMEGSRGFDSLKLWLALMLIGVDGYGKIIDDRIEQARLIASWVNDKDDFEIMREPITNIFNFRFIPKELKIGLQSAMESGKRGRVEEINEIVNNLNRQINETLSKTGYINFAATTLEDTSYRAAGYPESSKLEVFTVVCINPFTTHKELWRVFEHIAKIGYKIYSESAGLDIPVDLGHFL